MQVLLLGMAVVPVKCHLLLLVTAAAAVATESAFVVHTSMHTESTHYLFHALLLYISRRWRG